MNRMFAGAPRLQPAARKATEISRRLPARARSGGERHFSSAGGQAGRRRQRRAWIATDGWQVAKRIRRTQPGCSWLLLLFGQRAHGFLRLAKIVQRQAAGFDQVRHDRLGTAPEKAEKIINEPALAACRETMGSKMCALLIFFARRTIFFFS